MRINRFYRTVSVLALAVVGIAPAFPGPVRNIAGFSSNTLAANDDLSTGAVGLGFGPVNFFGSNTGTVFVNNNGNVTFNSALGQFTPNGLSTGVGQPIIAPFFADVDTLAGNLVTYGTGTVTDATLGWSSAAAFGVEWPAVGYFASHINKLNTFELILVDRSGTGAGNFDIEFNYNQIQWETGDFSGGTDGLGGTSAAVGYSNGMSGGGNVFFQLPGSLVNGALLDGGIDALISGSMGPDHLAGRYDFQVRNGIVIPPTPEPASMVLVVAGLVAIAARRRRRNA